MQHSAQPAETVMAQVARMCHARTRCRMEQRESHTVEATDAQCVIAADPQYTAALAEVGLYVDVESST